MNTVSTALPILPDFKTYSLAIGVEKGDSHLTRVMKE